MPKTMKDRAKLTKIEQFPLLPEDVKHLVALKVTESEFWASLEQRMREGWFFDCIKNEKDDEWACLAKQGNHSILNAGTGFYSRGNTMRAAMVSALYKLDLLDNQELGSFLSERGSLTSFG